MGALSLWIGPSGVAVDGPGNLYIADRPVPTLPPAAVTQTGNDGDYLALNSTERRIYPTFHIPICRASGWPRARPLSQLQP